MKLATLIYIRRDGKTLMVHRNKKPNDMHMGKWNGMGGKLEPGESPEECTVREAREETGIADFAAPLSRAILDVDVHPIPARGSDPAHFHFDVRYLLTTERDADPAASDDPTRPIRWASLEEAVALGVDASLERALAKARWALLEMGRNSVSPCTIPMTSAWNVTSTGLPGPAGLGRAEAGGAPSG